jgi:hypothetical protein
VIECRRCGHGNEDGAQFCANCQAFLEWQGTRPTAERPQSAIAADLDCASLQVVPGGRAECRARIRNTGKIIDELRLEVVGDAAGWAAVEPALMRLFPGTSEVARIVFSPPRAPQVTAGPTRYGLKVSSTVRPEVYTVENDLVDVGPYVDWSAELVPPHPSGEGTATVQVRVRNSGNAPLQVAVSGRSSDGTLAVDGAPGSLTVAPGQSSERSVQLRSLQPAPAGGERSHPFQAVVASLEGREVTLDGSLLQHGPAIRVEWYARLLPPSARAAGPSEHRVQVFNRGQAPLTVGIQALDPAGALELQLSVPSLTVPPGVEVEAMLRVTPVEGLARGPERQRPFQVVVTADDRRAVIEGLLLQVPPTPEPPLQRSGRRRWRWLALAALLLAGIAGTAIVMALSPFGIGGRPSATPIQVSVLDEIGTSRCETSETVDVVIDGQRRGTLTVDSTGHADATRHATLSGAGSHDYQLKATGSFNVKGRRFQLHGGGGGSISVSDTAHSFSVEVDEKVLPLGQCPAEGGSWPLLLRPR